MFRRDATCVKNFTFINTTQNWHGWMIAWPKPIPYLMDLGMEY
jgi:hypothetical protein